MPSAESLRKAWEERARSSPCEPVMTITEAGLVLGAGTVLAKRSGDVGGRPSLAIDGNEERILALLASAYGRPVDAAAIDHIQRASRAYAEGGKCLALIHLAHTGLTALEDEESSAFRLFLANELLDAGLAPHDLLEACGLYAAPDMGKAGFNPDEPRVPAGNPDGGQWTDGGGAGLVPAAARGRAGGDEYRTGNPDKFFDTVYAPFHALAQRLGIDETWLFGLAANESGFLNAHDRRLNDPFGVTHGGRSNVHYDSIDAAVAYWERRFGPVVRGATSAEDFVQRLYAAGYNTETKEWSGRILDAIDSIPRRLRAWKARRDMR